MPKFSKKPVEIEARDWIGGPGAATPVIDWVLGSGGTARYHGPEDPHGEHIVIDTLEGSHRASPGDYVIRGVQGEFYPCKPDIFEATYEPAGESDDAHA